MTSADPSRCARVAERTAPARAASAATPTFPVTWDDPSDAGYTWTFERMHAPEPMTLGDAVAFQCAFDHGATAAARAYGVPFRALTRRINTYLYLALVPTSWPAVHAQAGADPLEAAIGRLDELWDDEYLPEIKQSPPVLGSDRSGGPDLAAARRRGGRERRPGETSVRDPFPDLVPLHVRDQPVRRLLPRRPRQRQRLRRVPLAAGLREHDGGEWTCAVAAQPTGASGVASVRAVLEQEPADGVTVALAATPDGRRFLDLLHEYLEEWGQRGDRWGWSFPSWIEDPTPVIKTLQTTCVSLTGISTGNWRHKQRSASDSSRKHASGCAAIHRTCATASSSSSRPPRKRSCSPKTTRIGSISAACTTCIGSRSRWVDASRRQVVVDRPDDVFLLTHDELRETATRIASAEPAHPDRGTARRDGVLPSSAGATHPGRAAFRARHPPTPSPSRSQVLRATSCRRANADSDRPHRHPWQPRFPRKGNRACARPSLPGGRPQAAAPRRAGRGRRPRHRGRRCSPPPPRSCPTRAAFSATAQWSPASTASRPSSAPGTRLHGSPTAN